MTGVFGLLTNVAWTSAGPVEAAGFNAHRLRAAVGQRDRLRRRQVPADGRLRHPLGRPDRRRRPGAAGRAPGRGHDGHARGLRQLQRRHARAVDGRGPDQRRRRRRAPTATSAAAPRSWARCPAAARRSISIGSGCLLGANAGIGISLGDGCVVEAGCYVTGGSRVTPARRLGGQGPRAVRAATGCCSAATASAARSRPSPGTATGARSTPSCTRTRRGPPSPGTSRRSRERPGTAYSRARWPPSGALPAPPGPGAAAPPGDRRRARRPSRRPSRKRTRRSLGSLVPRWWPALLLVAAALIGVAWNAGSRRDDPGRGDLHPARLRGHRDRRAGRRTPRSSRRSPATADCPSAPS